MKKKTIITITAIVLWITGCSDNSILSPQDFDEQDGIYEAQSLDYSIPVDHSAMERRGDTTEPDSLSVTSGNNENL